MNRLEKIAAYGLFGVIGIVVGLNAILAFGGTIRKWDLPILYLLCLIVVCGARAWRGLRLTWLQVVLAVGLPLVLLAVAYGLGHTYDTSWDGQDYQSSAVIELAHGWNPWHQSSLPLHLPTSAEYVQGYPKSIWLIQASIYALTGNLQTTTIVNVVLAACAALLVFGALRRLRIARGWNMAITTLAVAEIHFLQQMPTFMADGYSYQLCLIAIASFVMLLKDRVKTWPLALFLSAWLLLAGGKFSNLFICALLGLVLLIYAYRTKAYRLASLRWVCVVFAIVGIIMLWVPYGTNTLRNHSPVYPQNQANENAKLRFDNVPNNLKHDNRVELLFYGIFSGTEPSDAGNPTSTQNVAQLKIPFTFHSYEVHETNNFQGRVGSGGTLFSGIVVLTALLFALLWFFRPATTQPRLLLGLTLLIGLIIIAALFIPVPNKLRYSPLITLIPLLVVTGVAGLKDRRPLWARLGAALLILCIVANTIIAAGALIDGRINDAKTINSQLSSLRNSGAQYEVSVASFYSNYARLQDAGVHVRLVDRVSCPQPVALQASFGTTLLCKIN